MTPSIQTRAIEVDMLNSSNSGDRRSYSRYPLEIGGELASGDVRNPCIIRDFSGTGMSLTTAIGHTAAETAGASPRVWQPGEPVEMLFELPDNNGRVRARAMVRRIARHGQEPRLGVAFENANPAVFEALLKVSDRSRLSTLSHYALDQGNSFSVNINGWDAVSCYLSDVLDTCFHRSAERLHLKAHYATSSTSSSQWYFGLVAIKAMESSIRNLFVRNVVEGVYASGGDAAGETMDELSVSFEAAAKARSTRRRRPSSDVLDGLSDRAMLQLLAQRDKPMSAWIGSAPEAPITPAALFRVFKAACVRSTLHGDNLDLLLRTFREGVTLHWPFTRRVLQAKLRIEQRDRQPAHAA